MPKNLILFIIIGCLLFLTRVYKIDRIPAALFSDELVYAVQAQSLASTGLSTYKDWNPLSFKPFEKNFAELPAQILVPGFFLSSNPLVAAKIIPVLFGIIIPFLLAWVAFGFFQDKRIFWVTVFLGILNPWLWQYSRMSFDPLLGMFFYLLGMGLILNLKGYKILWGFLPLVLGFFQYQGFKLIFLPILLIPLIYKLLLEKRWNDTKRLCPILITGCLGVIFFCWYMFVHLPSQPAADRVSTQLILTNTEYLSSLVNDQRRLSFSSTIGKLFVNKFTVMVEHIGQQYVQAIDPLLLFYKGEGFVNRFSVGSHGYFYLLDLILIIIGLIYLFKRSFKQRSIFLFFVLLLFCPLPAVLNIGDSFSFRASFLYLLLIILSAVGLVQLSVNKYLLKSLIIVYLISGISFGFHYFYRYPLYATDNLHHPEKLLAHYLRLSDPNQLVIVHTPEPELAYRAFIFYNKRINTQSINEIQLNYSTHQYSIGKVSFIDSCFSPELVQDNSTHIVSSSIKLCPNSRSTYDQRVITISNIADAGDVYRIFNDKVCTSTSLRPYISLTNDSSFQLSHEALQFCAQWLTEH